MSRPYTQSLFRIVGDSDAMTRRARSDLPVEELKAGGQEGILPLPARRLDQVPAYELEPNREPEDLVWRAVGG